MDYPIEIPVKLDEKTFRRFAWYDTLILRKKWIRPVVFSAILIVFAFVALISRREQSGMIAAVLLAVGIGLPVVYVGSFLSQVNMQAMQHKLKPPRKVYTVRLEDQGIRVENNQKKEEPLELPWSGIAQAIRRKKCIYLYVTPVKAFLLPAGQANVPDNQVWEMMVKHLKAKQIRKG